MRCVYVLEYFTSYGSHLVTRSFSLSHLLSSEHISNACSWRIYKGLVKGDNLFGLWFPFSLVARSVPFYCIM